MLYDKKIRYTFDGKQYTLEINKHSSIVPNTKERTFYIRTSCLLLNPQSIVRFGDWSDDRIAHLLPLNYRPKLKSAE